MEIANCTQTDIDEIFRLYTAATQVQAAKDSKVWPIFERALVALEIDEQRQWKLIEDGRIRCVWATTFSDPLIWEEKNNDPAIYVHRIAVDPAFKGHQLVNHIIDWARPYAHLHGKKLLRLDTVGENKGLIKHYTRCGFNFLGLSKIKNSTGLPPHYNNAWVSLFELTL